MECVVVEKRTKVRPVTDEDIRIAQLEGRPLPKAIGMAEENTEKELFDTCERHLAGYNERDNS